MSKPEAASKNDGQGAKALVALVRLLARQVTRESLTGLAEQEERPGQPTSTISTERRGG